VLGELVRPLSFRLGTCALDIIGARFVRDVENGEIVVISEEGVESLRPFPPRPMRPCIFEYIYFARPDSVVHGRRSTSVRKAMGAELARERASKPTSSCRCRTQGCPPRSAMRRRPEFRSNSALSAFSCRRAP